MSRDGRVSGCTARAGSPARPRRHLRRQPAPRRARRLQVTLVCGLLDRRAAFPCAPIAAKGPQPVVRRPWVAFCRSAYVPGAAENRKFGPRKGLAGSGMEGLEWAGPETCPSLCFCRPDCSDPSETFLGSRRSSVRRPWRTECLSIAFMIDFGNLETHANRTEAR